MEQRLPALPSLSPGRHCGAHPGPHQLQSQNRTRESTQEPPAPTPEPHRGAHLGPHPAPTPGLHRGAHPGPPTPAPTAESHRGAHPGPPCSDPRTTPGTPPRATPPLTPGPHSGDTFSRLTVKYHLPGDPLLRRPFFCFRKARPWRESLHRIGAMLAPPLHLCRRGGHVTQVRPIREPLSPAHGDWWAGWANRSIGGLGQLFCGLPGKGRARGAHRMTWIPPHLQPQVYAIVVDKSAPRCRCRGLGP